MHEDSGCVGEAERRERVAGGREHGLSVERGEHPLPRLHQVDVPSERLVFLEQGSLGQRPVDRVVEDLGVERLHQIVRGAALDRSHGRLDLVQPGDHQHRGVGARALDVLEELHAVSLRENEVCDDYVELSQLQGFFGLGHGAHGGDLVTRPGEEVMVEHSGDLFVVDEEDLRH